MIGRLAPGAAVAALLAAAATLVASLHGGPQMLYALFFGLAFHVLHEEPRLRPGIDWCARTVLRLGVGLLGARITAGQIAALGLSTALLVVAAVALTVGAAVVLGKRLGLARAHAVVAGAAVAICGASAALAVAAVCPRGKAHERDTVMVVVAVTVLSTAAMVLYPLVARAAGFAGSTAGIFLGATIHDVAQVVGAGYTLGNEAGDTATVVKLLRVALLAPLVLAVGAAFRRDGSAEGPGSSGGAPLVPWFLWLFAALVVAGSAGWLAAPLRDGLGLASRGCLVAAIAALGVKTSFMELARAGWRPLALIGGLTFGLASFVLTALVLQR